VTQSKDRTGRVSPPQGRGESEDASQPGKSAFAVKRAGPPLPTPVEFLKPPAVVDRLDEVAPTARSAHS